jgi:hypothetical protein
MQSRYDGNQGDTMSLRTEVKKAGYDYSKYRDAKTEESMTITVEPCDVKGAVIGDGTCCSGARAALRQEKGIEWVYVGASIVAVAFKDGRLLRYLDANKGQVAKTQDALMYPAGHQMRLVPPASSQSLNYVRGRTFNRTGEKPKCGRRRSVAAQMRS